jgi:hypothetical protein
MESSESPLVCEKVGEAMPDIAGIGVSIRRYTTKPELLP